MCRWEERHKFMIIYLNFCTSQNDCNEGKVAKGAQCLDILFVCYQARQYIYISWPLLLLLHHCTRGIAEEQRYSGNDGLDWFFLEKEGAGKAEDIVVRMGKSSNSWHNSTWNNVLLVLLLVYILNKFSLVLAWNCHNNSYTKKLKRKNLVIKMKQGKLRHLNSYSDSVSICFGKIMCHLLKTLNDFSEEVPLC